MIHNLTTAWPTKIPLPFLNPLGQFALRCTYLFFNKLMSDHHVICSNIDLPKPKQMRVTSTVRNYRNIDHNEFCKSLTDFTSNCPSTVESDCDSMFKWYSSGMENLLESYAPSTTRTRLVKSRMPWYNETIHLARQHRRQAERKWRKSRSADDRELYLTAKNHVNDLTIKAKRNYQLVILEMSIGLLILC